MKRIKLKTSYLLKDKFSLFIYICIYIYTYIYIYIKHLEKSRSVKSFYLKAIPYTHPYTYKQLNS